MPPESDTDTHHVSNCSPYCSAISSSFAGKYWHTLSQLNGSARLLSSLSLSLFSFSLLSLSATHLGLVIHDSWSRVSKFNLRCDKTAHIYKLCAQSLPIWIVLTSFFCQTCAAYQTHNTQPVCTKGRSTNRLNGEESCQSNDKECNNNSANGICLEWKGINLQHQTSQYVNLLYQIKRLLCKNRNVYEWEKKTFGVKCVKSACPSTYIHTYTHTCTSWSLWLLAWSYSVILKHTFSS